MTKKRTIESDVDALSEGAGPLPAERYAQYRARAAARLEADADVDVRGAAIERLLDAYAVAYEDHEAWAAVFDELKRACLDRLHGTEAPSGPDGQLPVPTETVDAAISACERACSVRFIRDHDRDRPRTPPPETPFVPDPDDSTGMCEILHMSAELSDPHR